jgi:hypothetical protein
LSNGGNTAFGQAFLVAFAGAGFLMLLNGLEWRLRARRVTGTVVDSRVGRTSKGRQMYSAVYEYIDPIGGSTVRASGTRQSGRTPELGTTQKLLVMSECAQKVRETNSFQLEIFGAIFCAFGLWMLYQVAASWFPVRVLWMAGVLAAAYVLYGAYVRPSRSTVEGLASALAGEASALAKPRAAPVKGPLWVIPLFVLDMALLVSPPEHKTGYAAFGALLFILGCLLAFIAIAWQLITLFAVAATRVAGAVKTTELSQLSSPGAASEGASMVIADTAPSRGSRSGHGGHVRKLWMAVGALFVVSGGLLATGLVLFRLQASG